MTRRLPLTVDKISFTLPVARAATRNRISESLPSDEAPLGGLFRREFLPQQSNYLRSYSHSLGENATLLIQVSPRRETHNYLRLEFNPNVARPEGVERVRTLLYAWLGTEYRRELAGANVTGVDFSVDVIRTKLEHLLIGHTTARKSCMYFGADGMLESIYLGAPSSRSQYLIYDKSGERHARDGMLRSNRIRFEVSLRGAYSFATLNSISNPYAALTIREYEKAERADGSYRWHWFLDSCRRRGAVAALRLISNAKSRSTWRRKVREVEPPVWWSPREIWAQRHEALRRIDLLRPP